MRSRPHFFASRVLAALLLAAGFQPLAAQSVDRYNVWLEDQVARHPADKGNLLPTVSQVAASLTGDHGGLAGNDYEHCTQGFTLLATAAEAAAMALDTRVRAVDIDAPAAPVGGCHLNCIFPELPPPPVPFVPTTVATPASILDPQAIACADPEPLAANCTGNWGLDRMDDRNLPRDGNYVTSLGTNGASNVHVYVVDSGIYATHPEFGSRVSGGINAHALGNNNTPQIGNTQDATCSRHGTSVASVIGGRTYGVAKQVNLHPVRFTNDSGSSNRTDWLTALDWVAGNFETPAVINISSNVDLEAFPHFLTPQLQECIQGVLDLGIPIVESAGNRSGPSQLEDACDHTVAGPAAGVPGVIVAGGSDQFDQRWTRDQDDTQWEQCFDNPGFPADPSGDCGSNVGSCVDVWAPAAHIVTAHGYAAPSEQQAICTTSGTSFAAPHVTGAIALYLSSHPTATLAQIEQALKSGAFKGVLGNSINDPDPNGSGSNNRLASAWVNNYANVEASMTYVLGNAPPALRVRATATNLGSSTATNLVFTVHFQLPEETPGWEMAPIENATSECTYNSSTRTYTCSVAELAASATKTYQWDVMPPGPNYPDMPVTTTLTSDVDPDATNNQAVLIVDNLPIW